MTETLCPLRHYKKDTVEITGADMFLECIEGHCAWFYEGECAITRIASISEDITTISRQLEEGRDTTNSSLISIAEDITRIMSKYEHSDDVYEEDN
jgi:hypothetical protein